MAQNKVPSLDKSGSASKTETEHTVKLDSKKISSPLASSYDKNMEGQEQTNMTIKANKSAHDDQSYSSMSVSKDRGRIPRKKEKKNYQKLQSQGIKQLKIKTRKVKKQKLVVALKEQNFHQY